MGSAPISVQRYGLTEAYAPTPASSALVDLVLVHGLNGDPHDTWTSKATDVFWPAQLLPQFVEEQRVRVLVYGYDADVTSFRGEGATKDKIHNHAERLMADLFANRRIRKATERPIVFLAHSLGGLVVKRALIASSEISGPKTEHLRSIFVSTYGILFLGTPHKGSDLGQWGSYLERLCRTVVLKKLVDTEPQLVDALKSNSETLQNIDRQFAQLMDDFHLYFFHEAKPTDLKGTFRFIVDEESAAPTLPDVERASIQADHSHMCKFDSDNAPGFDLVVDGIQRYSEESVATIRARWVSETEGRTAQRIRKAKELFPFDSDRINPIGTAPSVTDSDPSQTPGSSLHDLRESEVLKQLESIEATPEKPNPITKSSEPYFIVPPGFGINTFFVGMEKELLELDKKLFDKRRKVGTACVLLHGQAGAGKSHLARQYVNKYRNKFKGGIFWINAKIKDELYKDYWQIAQKVVAVDSPELRISGDGTGDSSIKIVKTWFESRTDWLIVLDGVTVDEAEDAMELQSYVPNSKNSSLIYISMAKRLESMHRLLRPYAIKVPPLKESDARNLLFKEIQLKRPNDAQVKRATELVKEVGGLPLAINAISHRLADTHERLETYKIPSYSADRKLGGPYHQIMHELQERGQIAAFNLINILCFYGPHIPVEMVHLGLKGLRNENFEVKSSGQGEKPDINTTYGILIRYALIERNEPSDRDSMSSSRDSLVDPEPIDTLKIHSVVQNFCRDALKADNLLPIWLGYAVKVFCCSFHEADFQIKIKPEPGRVSDYREYLVHGHYLRGHLSKHENKLPGLVGVRRELEETMMSIESEVRSREPNSSQESVHRVEFQASIFDTTNSGSSSISTDPGVRPPNHRPTPLPLSNENEYGIPFEKPSVDSPRSIRTSSPMYGPGIVGHDPHTRYLSNITHNVADNDSPESYPMQENLSSSTARPASDSQDEGWETVQSKQKFKKSRYRYNLGNFRPSSARVEVNRGYATGSVTQPPQERRGRLSGSSDAVTALTAVHQASPSPSRAGRSFLSHSRSPAPSRLSYAKVLMGQSQRPSSSHQPKTSETTSHAEKLPPLTSTAVLGRGQSTELLSQSGNVQRSPLSTEVVQRPQTSRNPQKSTKPSSPPLLLSESSADTSTSSRSRFPYQRQNNDFNPNYQRLAISGPNPAPLPIDPNFITTSKRPTSRGKPSRSPYRPPISPRTSQQPSYAYQSAYPQFPHYPFSPTNPPSASFPSGYYSQPTSRIHSQQSHISAATEPPPAYPNPLSSPYLGSGPVADPGSPRTRRLDGSPSHKSPKIGSSYPVVAHLSRNNSFNVSPHNTAYINDPGLLSYTGDWAAPNQAYAHFSPGPGSNRSDYSPPTPSHMSHSMSRGSSGPGMMIDEGHGLGIAEFSSDVLVHFGQLEEPVRVEDARQRARERERRLLEIEKIKSEPHSENRGARATEQVAEDVRMHFDHDHDRDQSFEAELMEGQEIYHPSDEERRAHEERNLYGRSSAPMPAPYPETSRMPTGSDPVMLNAMLERELEGRRRGHSAPGREERMWGVEVGRGRLK